MGKCLVVSGQVRPFYGGYGGGKLDRCMRVSNAFNADKSEPLCGIETGMHLQRLKRG